MSLINTLFERFSAIRYVAVYKNGILTSEQRQQMVDASSSDSDKYEELLVNPALLTLARQRGNIDCGGLRFLLVAYGNFYQLVKEIEGGHISICLELNSDIIMVANEVLAFLDKN